VEKLKARNWTKIHNKWIKQKEPRKSRKGRMGGQEEVRGNVIGGSPGFHILTIRRGKGYWNDYLKKKPSIWLVGPFTGVG